MNFDNCNYVISNADSLIRSLLSQASSSATNNENGYTTSTDNLMGRQQSSSSSDGGFLDTIMIIVGFVIVFSLLNGYINKRKNKLSQKGGLNQPEDNNNDRDTSPVM